MSIDIVRTRPTMRLERLVTLCKLWGTVKYFHPYLAYGPIGWDGALVNAIAEVSAAQTTRAYAAAMEKILATLDDPATRVTAQTPAEDHPLPTSYLTDDHTLVVTGTSYDAQFEIAL